MVLQYNRHYRELSWQVRRLPRISRRILAGFAPIREIRGLRIISEEA